MRNRTFPISLLSAGLMLGGLALPTARADDQTKETTPAPKEKPAGEGRQGFPMLDRFRTVVDDLKLSDDQKTKVDGFFSDAKTQLGKAREDAAGDRQEMMKKSRESFDKLRENINSVLTDDQKEQLKTKMQGLFQGGGQGPARIKEILDKLNLSDDQKAKVHDIMEDVQKKARELREAGGEGSREKLGELLKDSREKIANVLTDDQKEKFKELSQKAGTPNGGPRNPDKKPDPQ